MMASVVDVRSVDSATESLPKPFERLWVFSVQPYLQAWRTAVAGEAAFAHDQANNIAQVKATHKFRMCWLSGSVQRFHDTHLSSNV